MNKKILFSIMTAFLLCCPWFVKAAAPVKITQFRLFKTDETTRIILNLTDVTHTQVFTLENPHRLVLDFANTSLNMNVNMMRILPAPLKDIRSGHPVPNTLRIVIDVNQPFTYKKIPQLDEKQMVIDLYPRKNEISPKTTTISAPEKMVATVKPRSLDITPVAPPAEISLKPEAKKRPFIVVIDAGHGGKDTGAIGINKTREKDVVLAIALQLAELINQQPNMRAVLTRKGDYFVTLANRLVLARKGEADLFIAIHADSYFNDRASGASVFALSSHGATTVAARWLADKENHSELSGVELNNLNDKSYLLRSVLIDLAQTATVRDSLRFGNSVLNTLESITKLHAERVEQAPFMVLKSPDIPSILVETGFISNETEEMRLRDSAYQRKIALALFNGIRSYQSKYAPIGT